MSRDVELRADFIPEGLAHQLLAVVTIESDRVEPWGGDDRVRRAITAIVRHPGPLWDRFMSLWTRGGVQLVEGRPFFFVNGLQIEHDYYPFNSFFSIADLPRMHLLVFEHFRGPLDVYHERVRERNARVQAFYDAWDNPHMTRNDLRELVGLERMSDPRLNTRMSSREIAEMRELHFRTAKHENRWRNMVV